jgi:hypothetical protein
MDPPLTPAVGVHQCDLGRMLLLPLTGGFRGRVGNERRRVFKAKVVNFAIHH